VLGIAAAGIQKGKERKKKKKKKKEAAAKEGPSIEEDVEGGRVDMRETNRNR
jgi:hypothetical protein